MTARRHVLAGWSRAARAACLLACALLLPAGCKARRVAPPPVSPEEAAKQALAEYDKNGDGAIDTAEAERCPALRNSFRAIDKNGDGKLSAQEIADRIASYQEGQVGLVLVACQVTLDGKPLAGATVTFVPEKFLGDGFKRASGVSDDRGLVQPQTEGADGPGVACGFYRIEVSRQAGGQETLPARYNVKTVLGLEVAPDAQRGVLPLRLSSS
jgi:hypothetical protein